MHIRSSLFSTLLFSQYAAFVTAETPLWLLQQPFFTPPAKSCPSQQWAISLLCSKRSATRLSHSWLSRERATPSPSRFFLKETRHSSIHKQSKHHQSERARKKRKKPKTEPNQNSNRETSLLLGFPNGQTDTLLHFPSGRKYMLLNLAPSVLSEFAIDHLLCPKESYPVWRRANCSRLKQSA